MGTGSHSSGMCRGLSLGTGLAILALCLTALPAAGPAAEVWKELLASRPQEYGVPVAGVVLVRDAFTFHLDSGAFFPLAEVSGRVVGGVFQGKGRFELKPATESERAFLARRAGREDLRVLNDSFEEAVFLFADGSGKELLQTQPSVPANPEKLASIYDDALEKTDKGLRAEPRLRLIVDKELHADLRLRLVPDLIEAVSSPQGLFLAYFDGHELPPALAIFSPRGLVRTWLETASGPETTALAVLHEEKGGFWYSERPLADQASASALPAADLVALHYSIETTIRKNTDIEGRTTLRLRAGRDGVRVIPLDLFSKLRLSSVRLDSEAWAAVDLPFIQGDEKSADPILAVLPQPLALGEEVELTAEYQGDEVIHARGSTNFYPGAGWYTALNGSRDWADYDLIYRLSKKAQGTIARKPAEGESFEIVSPGSLVESGEAGDFAVYRYTTERPIRVASFNYGIFHLIERDDPDSGLKIRVYPLSGLLHYSWGILPYDSLPMAQDVLADSVNTARVGTVYFGPLPQKDIAVMEKPETIFVQSTPTLVYVPHLAFLDKLTRDKEWPGIGEEAISLVEEATTLLFARQWWGDGVGSATYRDVWLEGGLAEFTVGLVVEKALGAKAAFNFWGRARKNILGLGWHPHYSTWKAGPISLGSRLDDSEASQAIVISKGAFVVHMLRNLFWDEMNPNPDERFMDTMKDFFKTWAGRSATTADFRAFVERHAPPDFAGDMGWFFREWIEGTAIPRIKAAIRIEEAGNEHYRLTGEITQSEVPEDFRSILPLYVELEKNRFSRCAQVSITGNRMLTVRQEISLPKKPLRVLVNPNHAWLTR